MEKMTNSKCAICNRATGKIKGRKYRNERSGRIVCPDCIESVVRFVADIGEAYAF